jgi:hypothetical protein
LIGGVKQQRALEQRMAELQAVRRDLTVALDEFRKDKRFTELTYFTERY